MPRLPSITNGMMVFKMYRGVYISKVELSRKKGWWGSWLGRRSNRVSKSELEWETALVESCGEVWNSNIETNQFISLFASGGLLYSLFFF